MIGQKLSHYTILGRLGAGGMGEVYLAHDEILERKVAVKTVRTALLAEPMAKARFLREARAVAALSHANIAAVFDAGESDDGPYLVMEYVEGGTLNDLRGREEISVESWVDYATQLAAALEHAHGRGILHRDIKSSNVMVASNGTLKLLDFGLARPTEEGSQAILTAAGSFVGTLHYAAPELLSGVRADIRSDIYSLGVVYYELACGRLPFEGQGGATLISSILHREPESPHHWNPKLSQSVERIIGVAMSRKPDERFADATALLAKLRALTDAEPRPSPIAPTLDDEVVAVLPFDNLSGHGRLDWLGTGLAETLGVELGHLEGLRLVGPQRLAKALARSSEMVGTESARCVALGRVLGARWIITGAFQHASDRLRITYRLMDVLSGEEALQDKVDGPWKEVFSLQDRVAGALARALRRKFQRDGQMEKDDRMLSASRADTDRLQAYELYTRARQAFTEFGKHSLEEAQRQFEGAIELNPNYAVAFAALGATHSMRYIHRADPDDLNRALRHLERAVALDPELGEPYPWLCYAYARQGHIERAIQAGLRGVQLQPDLVTAHYFLGVAYLIDIEYAVDGYQDGIGCLLDATVADPQWGPAWLVLADVALRLGEYDRSREYAKAALALEEDPTASVSARFVGAQMLLGWVAARQNDPEDAQRLHRKSIENARKSDHVYREQFIVQSTLALAELELRGNGATKALSLYRRAWQIAGQYPTMLGAERLLVRALAGMAAAYAEEGNRSRAEELLAEATRTLLELPPQNWFWGAAFSQLGYDLLVAHIRLGDCAGAVEALATAVRTGWRDTRWLEEDPELGPLRDGGLHSERFRQLTDEVRAKPAARFEPAGRAIESLLI